jgi:triosephosphate isomerase
MRTPLIAGNWKMFKTVHEAVVFTKELRSVVKDVADVEIVVAPPFTALHAVAEAARNSNIGIAAQNLHWERDGAFTGEVCAAMIKEAGAEYVIVGHSERRRLFGESDAIVNRKTMAAIGAGLTPIVCVGETLEEREAGETLAVLDRQIKNGLDAVSADQVSELVLAYEPVWAIGTGRNATAAITPGLPYGRTEVRIISHLVAPRASAASSLAVGVCMKTSREREVTIGNTMIDSTRLPSRIERPNGPSPPKIGSQPK